jgi:hypothetical protein
MRMTDRDSPANKANDNPLERQERRDLRGRDALRGAASDHGTSGGSIGYVLEPGGACNVYRWDAEAAVLELERVEYPQRTLGADLVQLPLLPREQSGTPREAAPQSAAWIQSLRKPEVAGGVVARGPSLLALLLTQPANPPGTRVSIRLLGAVRVPHPPASAAAPGGGSADQAPEAAHLVADYIAFGVPDADASLAHVATRDDLPTALMERLRHALGVVAPEALAAGAAPWLSAEAIQSRYREARAALRRAQRAEAAETPQTMAGERLFSQPANGGAGTTAKHAAEAARTAPLPAWRELSPITPAELRALGEAAYSAPEHLLRWVPHRFERYLSELLLPDERVLFFAELPALAIRGWSGEVDWQGSATRRGGGGLGWASPFGRLRTRHIHSGLLLITDRQVLHLRDYAPPDISLVEWGYLAHSWPLARAVGVRVLPAGIPLQRQALAEWAPPVQERLAGLAPFSEASVPADSYARLVVGLEAQDGIEIVGAAFPPGTEALLERAAARIERFVPAMGATEPQHGSGLRVVPQVEAWEPTEREAQELETLGGLVAEETTHALEAATRAALQPGEHALTQGRTPELGTGADAVPAMLTLTERRLLLARPAASGGGGAQGAQVRAWSLAALSSVTLQQSLLGSGLLAHVPRGGAGHTPGRELAIERISVGFPSPLLVPFRALYTRLRLLLGGPATEVEAPQRGDYAP